MKKMLIALICIGVVVSYASQPITDRIEQMDDQTRKQMQLERATVTPPPTYKVTGDYPHFNPDNGRAILLFEDFESGMPLTWKVFDGNAYYPSWRVGTTGDLLGYTPPNYGTAYAFYSDDDAGSGAPLTMEALISPAVYTGGAPCMFHYGYGYNDYSSLYDSFTVWAKYHDGAVWGAWNRLIVYNSDQVGVDTFNLAAAESVMVQFVFNEGPSATWGWACACDNVYIETPPEHDVGCSEVVDLEDGPMAPGTYAIKGRIQNYGANAETFDATAEVWDTDAMTMLWSNTYTFTSFPVGGNTVHNFGSYTFGDDMNFEVKIYTELVGDEEASNDTSVVYPRTAIGLGDIIFEMDAQTPTGDIRLVGIEFDGTYFYLSGSGDYYTTSYIHVLDTLGNLICQPLLPPWLLYGWGWMDLCRDGNHFYSSPYTWYGAYVDEFTVDPGTGTLTYLSAFPGPYYCNLALAYDPDHDVFLTDYWSGYIYKWNKTWSILEYNTNPDYWSMIGAAYDTDDDEGGWVWWHSQDGPDPLYLLQVEQFDPATMTFTGLTFNYEPTITTGIAGGMCFYEGFRGYDVLFTIVQGDVVDAIVGIVVREHIPYAEATIEFNPHTLNLSSGGTEVKCCIELEEGYDVYDIDPYSIRITKIDGVAIDPVYGTGKAVIEDNTLTTAFYREEVIDALGGIVTPPAYAELLVKGDVGEAKFAGTGTIRVINPTVKHDGAMGAELPVAFALYETSPNPFSSHTVIRYALPADAQVKLNIYDVSGRKVKALVNGTEAAGYHNVNWDARDDWGRRVSSGVYFVKFEAEDHVQTRKLLLLK